MTCAFSSLDALTNAVAESFSAPAVPPQRTHMDVARDFDSATDMLVQAQEREDTVQSIFMSRFGSSILKSEPDSHYTILNRIMSTMKCI